MSRWIILSCLVMALCVMGCSDSTKSGVHGRRAASALMDSAESIMSDDPQQAYMLLDSIDSGSLRSLALNARYALLYTEAQYKNYMPIRNDSLIMIAVRYYSVGNHAEQLFRSFYCLGCIYYELGQLTDAAVALGQAEQLAGKIDDGYRLGLLYTQLGSVYNDSYDINRSEKYFSRAYDCYKDADKAAHMTYALYDIACCKMDQHKFSVADSIFMTVQEWAVINKDRQLYINSIVNRLSCSLYGNAIDSSKMLIDRYLSTIGQPHDKCRILGLFAFYYIKLKEYDKSRFYLQEAWNTHLSVSDSINLYYLNSMLSASQGLSDEALEYHKQYTSLQNENLRAILRQPVLGAQKEFFQTIAEFESLKNRHSRTVLTLCIIIFVLILFLVLFFHHYQKKRIEEQLYDSLAVVEELSASNSIHTDRIAQLKSELLKQFHKRHDLSNLLYSIYYDTNSQEKVTRQQLIVIVNGLIKDYTSSEYIKKLDIFINESYDGLMERLSVKELELTDKELQILRFSFAGLTLKSVSIILKESCQNIYQIKSRLMKKIKAFSYDLWLEIDNLL